MPTHLLLAPAASGKTEYCLARIRELRRENPLAPIWVILPNGANAKAFTQRQARAGGAIGVHAITFYTLCEELVAEAGQLVARLDDAVLYRFLREVAVELHAAGRLNFFARIHTTPGFARVLHNAIQELKRARIAPEQFASMARGARLEELARLYEAYQQRLRESSWADGEGQGWLAALALENDPRLAQDWRLLVVDGFDEFNPTQLEVLRLLAARVGETLITLTGDPSAPARMAHRRFARARAALETSLPFSLHPLPPFRLGEGEGGGEIGVRSLEASLFEPAPRQVQPDGSIQFLEAPNRAEEVRAALRWLKARIIRDRFGPGEVALLARDLEPYRAFIEETAAEFGMPIYLSEGANLARNPAIASLLNLLAIAHQDFPRRRVVDAWRSPYADWFAQGVLSGDAARLDAAARWGQVIAGGEQWQDTLTRLARSSEEVREVDDDSAPLTPPVGTTAAALWGKFQAFAARLTPPAHATMRDYAGWVEQLIGDDPELLTEWQTESDTSLRLVECARANADLPLGSAGLARERDVAALREFKNVLRALVFAEAALGKIRGVSPAEFWTELRGAVEAAAYRVPPPDGVETILAAPVLAARGLPFRAVAVVGLAEGEFPRGVTEDPLLLEADRAALRLPSRLAGDEVTFFYEAVTRAREKLLLTRPCLADDGQPWEPSPYWEHCLRIVNAPVQRVRPQDALAVEDAASVPELISTLGVELNSMTVEATEFNSAANFNSVANKVTSTLRGVTEFNSVTNRNSVANRWEAVRAGAEVFQARLADHARGPYEGDLAALHARLGRDFAPTRPWSASRLEAYGTCPFAFFAAHALDLEPRAPVQAGYDVRQLGTMYHAILEKLFRDAPDPTNLDALLAALPPVAREIFDAAPERYGFRPTALWQHQRVELEQTLSNTLGALADASEGWRPAYFELAFGKDDAPPLVLPGEDGSEIRLRGYIDRVDVNSHGELRVVDYKSGSSPITAHDLDAGRRLQLALYARALRDALQIGEPVAGLYWHIGAARASSLKLEKYPGGAQAALEVAGVQALSHAARARKGDFAPRPPPGGCPEWCPATAFCWRYKPKW